MVKDVTSLAAALPPLVSGRGRRRGASWSCLLMVCTAFLISLSACATSPSVLTTQPAFAFKTSTGMDGVIVREPILGTTSEEFVHLVRAGMERAAPGSVMPGKVEPPFPTQRIVWHASSAGQDGTSWLMVNIFDGMRAVDREQEIVTNTAPSASIVDTIQSMTSRLLARTSTASS